MIRLWNRVGVFRPLSVLVIILGLVGGIALAGRESENMVSKTAAIESDADAIRHLSQDLADQRQAQSKADEIVVNDAQQAKVLEDETRKNTAATRSDPRATPSAKSGVTTGPIPASCSAYSGNKGIGCSLLLKSGYGLDQMSCLDKLWTKESGWRTTAQNPSGAYGIPQAKPGSKMAVFGADWQTNPATQISWGLNYIKGRYTTPCGAWNHSVSTGWY